MTDREINVAMRRGVPAHGRKVDGLAMTDPSKDIKDAFRMARGMIRICQQVGGPCMTERNGEPFYDCAFFKDRTCPARTFLDEHNQIDAWEVKT